MKRDKKQCRKILRTKRTPLRDITDRENAGGQREKRKLLESQQDLNLMEEDTTEAPRQKVMKLDNSAGYHIAELEASPEMPPPFQ